MSYLFGESVVRGFRLIVGAWSVGDCRVEDVPRLRWKHRWLTTKPHPEHGWVTHGRQTTDSTRCS